MDLTQATSTNMMSRPWKRGRACLTCRFRKLRCDEIKPVCGKCRTLGKDECKYSDGPARSRTKALEDTVQRLEARLHELEHSEDATPSVMRYDSWFPPQLPISPSYPSSSGSFLPYHQQPGVPSPLGSPLSSSPGSQEYAQSSPFSSPSPRATTPPYATYGRRSSPLGIFDSRVMITPESTSPGLEYDWNLCEAFLQTFRPHASVFGFFLHWGRFIQSTPHSVLPDGTIHNSSALLNTLYMWGAHLTSNPQQEVYFKTKALQSVAADLTPQSFLHTLQAEVLLSYFFFRTGHFLEARVHTGTAVALALGTGLHQIRSLNHPDAPVIGITEENDQAEEILLRASADAIEEGERINGFWAVFMLQKNLSVALEPPARVCGVFESGGVQIDTPWPLEMDDYEQGLLTSDIHGDSTVRNFLQQTAMPGYHERPSITVLNVKACILLDRAVYLHGQYTNVPEQEAQSWWTTFGVLDQLINSLRFELPDLAQLQVQGRSPTSRTILLTHSLLNAATIKLHSISYTDPTSRQNCLVAARDMFRFGGTNPQGLGYLNPMMGTLWVTACSVFIDELRRITATAGAASVVTESECEKEMLGSLHDGLDVLHAFARESLLMHHQLTKVLESMGSKYSGGLTRLSTETPEYRAQHLEDMSRLSRFPERQDSLPSVTRYEPYPRLPSRHRSRYRSSRNHYGSSRASSLGGFSDAGSEYESRGSSLSSSQREWNLSNYDLPAHQLILKELDLTGQITKSGIYPFDSGSAADIYNGVLNPAPTGMLNRPPTQFVAVKIFRRLHSESQNLKQICTSLYEEARIWKSLDHPSISTFLGIALDLGLSPALISPLFPSGSIMKYLRHNAKDPQEKLQMTTGVAAGLAYLHSQDIVHGNLCSKKVLIDGHGAPVICGYGMYKALRQPANTASLFSAPIRFAAPECFSDEVGMSSIRTMSRDVYAFSMVMLEILSGLEPYHHLPAEHIVFEHIRRGDRPIRTHLDIQVVTNPIWQLLNSLWNQNPSLRPSMSDTVSCLVQIQDEHSKMDTDSDNIRPEATSPPDATTPPDEKDDKTSSGEETNFGDPDIRGRDLNGRIKQDDLYPFASGGNSNIYRGKLSRSSGTKIRIAIKMIRMSDDGSGQLQDILRRLRREADVWSRLKHKNILPFIGVCEDLAPTPVLISPFYKSGHVGTYLRKHPKINRKELACGVASGLEFLHANDIVHGDLKVQNVLVNKRGVPCICDFGISKILSRRGFTTSSVGTAPYMAPELFFVIDGPAQEQSPSTTQSSDVYSFALLVLEILTSEAPKRRPSKPIVTTEILAQLQPKRADYDIDTVTNTMWSVLTQCWSFEPQLRPPIAEVLGELTAVFT